MHHQVCTTLCKYLCTITIYMSEELVEFPAACNIRDLEAFFRQVKKSKLLL